MMVVEMAGSRVAPSARLDAVLTARLDAIRLIGDRLSDPLTVVDRRFNLVYANKAAYAGAAGRSPTGLPPKCFTLFVRRDDSCPSCPALRVFDSGRAISEPYAPSDGEPTCSLVQAFPLAGADGETALVLQILRPRQAGASELAAGSPADPVQAARVGNLLGVSEPMRQLFDMIRLVADSQATVLLEGESGTGKELVARTIHDLSYRRDRPFVVVDCGSLPETLLESELFGHVKGAFTGAVSAKKGLFEEADGGTVFLDEIADTTLHFQSKLLRVLQEGEVKPVGSSRSVKVNVRIISATNKDLKPLIQARTFREDLYYRLAVLPLTLPPLRDRREDIPLLVEHFVALSCARHRKPIRGVTPGAMEALKAAQWPGNVRELQHTIERVVVTAPGPQLTLQDFFGSTSSLPAASHQDDLRSVARQAAGAAERARIQEALRQASGNKIRAARLLGISRASLYNKLKSYAIE